MMRTNYLLLCLALLILPSAYAAPQVDMAIKTNTNTQNSQQVLIDAVAVVVNDDVITRQELNDKLSVTIGQLKKQGTPLPPADLLEKQVLERMIGDMLQLQFAKESGVRVDDNQLDLAIGRIAEQNKIPSMAEFRAALEKDGIDYAKYREEVRDEMIFTRLREREVESKLIISDNEIDAYLANKAKIGDATEEFHLAHILVVVPEQASADKIQASLARADLAYKQLQGGADFAQVAAGFSDAKDALKGTN
jgi:peptidyl-prolyl cis-trans isomerase SurA